MSPTNSIWRDAPYLMQYIERCQSFLQLGEPDNDFLVYLPVRDMWRIRGPRNDDAKEASKNRRGGEDLLMQFDIHTMDEKAPQFIRSILTIDSLGYDCDYISDRQLAKVRIENGMLVTEGGTRYRALIIPTGTTLDASLQQLLSPLQSYVIHGESATKMALYAQAEPMKKMGLRAIRRKTAEGWHYFIANLTPNDVEADIALTVDFKGATLYNPMNGDITPAIVKDGKVQLALRSGESIILQTSNKAVPFAEAKPQPISRAITLSGPWALSFIEEAPKVNGTFQLKKPQTWETLSKEAAITMGTGVYTTTLKLTKQQARQHWAIDLGDVRESARVYINGQFIGCAWAVPFTLDCRNTLKAGKNEIRIEVTNLPANRIADLDRQGVKWRKFNEINVVDINYKKTTYAEWEPVKSGLNSEVKLYIK